MTAAPIKNVPLLLPTLSLREAKRQCILAAVRIHHGDAKAAAEYLGIGQSTMYRALGDLNITKAERKLKN